jgi:hypothetical protein
MHVLREEREQVVVVMERKTSTICLVTIHGIGFQQPPHPGIPGYADALHQQLSRYLDDTLLSNDPQRTRDYYGNNGPIYVQSSWPPGSNHKEAGLARLGTWTTDDRRDIDTIKAPLTNNQGTIAHIALVYSNLEGRGARTVDALLSTSMVAFSLGRYAHILDLARMLFRDIQGIVHHQPQQSPSNLSVRQDLLSPGKQNPGSLFRILHQLENDVAAYVCCDELRERIRSFVTDALLRLACREEVAEIIINAHSNGSVIAYDALRQLPPFVIAKVKAFVTSGNPLRKYVDFFRWGREIESMYTIPSWLNFWDPHDPVADPLSPPLHWRRETPIAASRQKLLRYINPYTGKASGIDITDIEVDNLRYSRGRGLQAHNYWQNETQFIRPLATLLKEAATEVEWQEHQEHVEPARVAHRASQPMHPRSQPGSAQ